MAIHYPLQVADTTQFPGILQIDIHDRAVWNEPGALIDTIFIYQSEDVRLLNTIDWERDYFANIAKGIKDSLSAATGAKASAGMNKLMQAKDALSKSASYATGQVLSKHPIMLFKEIGLRLFEFTFMMTSTSAAESQAIKNVVKTLRKYSHPANSTFGGGVVLDYPAEFMLKYLWMGAENPYLPKFKKSVITAIDADFAASGSYSMHRDGSPTVTKLTVRFTEVEALTRDDIESGY